MHKHSLRQLADLLQSKQISSVELTQHFLQRIEQHNQQLNCFISITEDAALQAAKNADTAIANGEAGPLTGIPLAHKDIFCTDGIKTSCGSKMLDNFIAPYNATVVNKFNHNGVVMLGKTNMDEFAMGSSNENSFYGAVKNPWDLNCVPGGSSGGSAACVAARLAPAATGTDTGGSIRQPAAFCGITGIKPTYGRVSRYGMIAFASSLDQAGPMAASAEDCALLLNAMAGFDEKDSTSSEQNTIDFTADLNQAIKGKKIGLPKQFFSSDLNPEIADKIKQVATEYEKLGAELIEIDLQTIDLAVAAYYVIAPAEASANLARYDGVRFGYRCTAPKDLEDLYKRSRAEAFGKEVKRRIMIGTYALSSGYYDAYYLKAQKIRRLIQNDLRQAFTKVDAILGPTTPSPAFAIGAKSDDPVSMYLSDVYTIAVNLAGLPALSMPAGFIAEKPIGAQLIANHFQENIILNLAHQYQQQTDWHTQIATEFVA